jgi:nucleotide-binding universal stress UspA family protein
MNKTIVLAVDAKSHVSAAADMTRELSQDSGDKVIVVHVHEFAVGRWGRMQIDCGEGEGEAVLSKIVGELEDAEVTAEGEIREAQLGHIARSILAAADEHNARVVVIGSGGRADLPHLPFGSVAHRLLHLARRPVLIVPPQQGTKGVEHQPEAATAAAV